MCHDLGQTHFTTNSTMANKTIGPILTPNGYQPVLAPAPEEPITLDDKEGMPKSSLMCHYENINMFLLFLGLKTCRKSDKISRLGELISSKDFMHQPRVHLSGTIIQNCMTTC